ncbi:hypothetical protein [Acinetobacter baumannii]|uniref:hypothetical protein n=1 Tax=Acinetobacter baumannii TaxID=470 RepID=UPI000DF49D17|nr:hypothetical protein [Acinetobacter baumannii]RCT89681.1 hypothetical protein DVA68_15900 [Acinetobacter baumannii]
MSVSEMMSEMERIYDVCKGVDGVYVDPLDPQAVIVCNQGKVMKLSKVLFESFGKKEQTGQKGGKKIR